MAKGRKKSSDVKVSYTPGSRAKNVVRILLDNTGRTRGGYASDYNFARSVATFGNLNGFITGGQMRILGAMYNRVIGGGKARSWSRL